MGVKWLNTNSAKFLFECSRDEAYKDFNNNLLNKEFLETQSKMGQDFRISRKSIMRNTVAVTWP